MLPGRAAGRERSPKTLTGVRDSPRLRDELEWCGRHGIPRSLLLGRELTSRTLYRYDDEGRLVEAVTVRESPWTEEDVSLALAWQAEQRLLCPGCGQPRDESVGKHAFEAYTATARTCHACAELDHAESKARRELTDSAGLHFELQRRPLSADPAVLAELGEVP
jgi:hypothetical protein